ncbi:MAG: mercuric reductase [Thermoanaerobaculia bacterium]
MSEPARVPASHLDEEALRLVEPLSEANRSLLEQVHPPDWTNPEPRDRYHLVVIGAGTAGLVSAAGAAGLGAKVALVERRLMGGDCLNVGCVPSKGVIRAAHAWHAARTGSPFGASETAEPGDFARAMERMREVRAAIGPVDGAPRFRDLGVDVFFGSGRFTSRDTVEVDGRRLRFRRAVIATGGRPTAPPIPGLAETGYLTNETIFSLTEQPRRLAVLGAGPIGCELAQAFARFGSEVTLFDIMPQVLIREDPDAAGIVQRALGRDGIRLALDARIARVDRRGNETVLTFRIGEEGRGEQVTADALLVAAGRAPNVEDLGLEAAGVEFDKKGVKVDDKLRTTHHRVYACGDVAAPYQFTHLADAQARIVIQNALFAPTAKASALTIPWCTFTSPEIAHVGLYEKDAEERGVQVDTLTVPLEEVDRARLDGDTEGFLRLHLEKGKDRILGATLVTERAGDMLGELCLAVTHGIGLGKIASTIHPYPTVGEVAKKAADAWNRRKLTPHTKRLLAWWFRLQG